MIQLVWATTHPEARCQNVNEQSGKCVDIILKTCLLRQSMDNVTCIFIAFSNFNNTIFENYNESRIETIRKNCSFINEYNIHIKEDESNKSNNQNNQNNNIPFYNNYSNNPNTYENPKRNPSQNFDEEDMKYIKREDSSNKKTFAETTKGVKNRAPSKDNCESKLKKLSMDFEQLPSINYNLTTQGNHGNHGNNHYGNHNNPNVNTNTYVDEDQYKKNYSNSNNNNNNNNNNHNNNHNNNNNNANNKTDKKANNNKLSNIKKILYNTNTPASNTNSNSKMPNSVKNSSLRK